MTKNRSYISSNQQRDSWDVTVWNILQIYLTFISIFQIDRLCNFGQISAIILKFCLVTTATLISLPVNMSKVSFFYTAFITCLMKAVFRKQGVSLKSKKSFQLLAYLCLSFFRT